MDLDKVNEVRRRSAAPRQRVGWVGFCYPALVPLPTLRSPAARRPRPAPPPCPAARRRRAGRPAGAPEGVRRGRAQAYLSLSRARGAEDSIALLDNVASEGSKPSWASSGGAHAEDEDEFGHLARPDRRPAPYPLCSYRLTLGAPWEIVQEKAAVVPRKAHPLQAWGAPMVGRAGGRKHARWAAAGSAWCACARRPAA